MTIRDALLRGRRRPRNLGAGSPTIYRGDGYEFVELRAYVPGDDVRRIDWAATARSGDLQTRVILEDVALTLAIVVDASPSMFVGRRRPLFAAAVEAVRSWFDAASADDRCISVSSDGVTPAAMQRSSKAVVETIARTRSDSFDPGRALRTALGALPRGSALLAISDWYDVGVDDGLIAELAARFDCTALVARDPWYDALPLHGMVRLRGAEGGALRAFVGARERAAYARAVREREAGVIEGFTRTNWRTGILDERDGVESLHAAFGLRRERAAVR